MSATSKSTQAFTTTRNACKLCAPLGASWAIRGVEGAVPVLHGSQGCATYIRRYMISHFKEPLDIASSSFGETAAIFGGRENLRAALVNVVRQYQPQLIGIASTCLAETIGDDVGMFLRELRADWTGAPLPPLVSMSTPSYRGTHAEGFTIAVRALVDTLAEGGPRGAHINLLPGMVSPADLRYLKEVCRDFDLPATILPDYSETLDGGMWEEYPRIPPGGTPIADIVAAGRARATIEFALDGEATAGALLAERFGVEHIALPLPIGVTQCDRWLRALETLSGRPTPRRHTDGRARLIDCYVDAHKYVFGKRAIVYGEQALVAGLYAFLTEIGITPVLCATGAQNGRLRTALDGLAPRPPEETLVCEGADFAEMEERAAALQPDIVIGNSKGYKLARRLNIPLVRVGFPIHDRIDGPRLLHVGYRGTQQLFDRIANALIEKEQDASPVGYSYM